MSIAILSVEPGVGHGAETVLCELLAGLVAESATNLPCVIAPTESRVFLRAQELGFACIDFPSREDRRRDHLQAAKALSLPDGLMTIHAWTARGFDPARILAQRAGAQCMGTLHDHPNASFHGWARRRIIRWNANRMDRLACVSQATADAARAAGYRCPIAVLRNGLRDLRGPEAAPPNDGLVQVAFLGMYALWKGFDRIADWITATAEEEVQWNLYGELHPELEALVARLPQAKIQCLGRQPIDDILRSNQVLVHASTQFDPYPTVLLEAACFGVPAIAANVGGAAEIVVEGETGWLFDDPAIGLDALRRLIGDSELRRQAGTAARARYESTFGVAGMVERYQRFWRGD